MNHHDVETHFIDLVERTLEPDHAARLEAHLDSCTQCRTRFAQYRALVQLEPLVSSILAGSSEGEHEHEIGRSPAELTASIVADCAGTAPAQRKAPVRLIAALGLTNVALLAVIGVMLFGTAAPNGGNGLRASAAPGSESYRTISMELDSSVADLSDDGALRADLVFASDRTHAPRSLARFVRVLSVEKSAGSLRSVQLMIREKDLERIQVARILGDVELSLYREGTRGDERADARARNESAHSSRRPESARGKPVVPALPSPPPGATPAVLYAPDPRSGAELRFVRTGESWTPEPGVAVTGF